MKIEQRDDALNIEMKCTFESPKYIVSVSN